MTKVTVITGYYNRAEVLRPTIESILKQTWTDLELIVFDDCSSDGTAHALAALEAELNDPRLHIIIHETNKGFVRGMIEAIDSCTSEYISVQGSGDISLPERLEKQIAFLDAKPDVTAVGCWYDNVVAGSTVRRKRFPNANDLSFEQLLEANVFSHGEVMIRRSAYDMAGGYREGFINCQDYDLWLRLRKIGPLGTVEETLYERFVRFDGVSYHPDKLVKQLRYQILSQRIAQLPTDEGQELYAKLEENGPMELIAADDARLQKMLRSTALRSVIWGGTKEAKSIAARYITSKPKAYMIQFMANTLKQPMFKPVLKLIRRQLGVSDQ